MFIAKNISKSINNNQILDDISLELKQGEITILFGSSGCGKTTLCRNLTLLDHPDVGSIEIDNKQYLFPNSQKDLYIPNKVNMVFQQLFLWPHLTNEANIKLAVKKFTKEKKEKFDYLIKLLNIENILGQYPNESSVGQKQRVAIARTLAMKPKFIFLDEITSALDIVQTKNIVKLLKQLKKEGIGMLIITHDLHFIKQVADNIIFMDNGKIVESRSKEIFQNPKSELLKEFLCK